MWQRHIVDSAQLLLHAGNADGNWLDLGTGAGFPGLVVAIIGSREVTLVEQRPLRAEFLKRVARTLCLTDRVKVLNEKLERLPTKPYFTISARAFAPLDRLLALSMRFSTDKTRWLLPKGRSAQTELDAIGTTWQGEFSLLPSITDPEAHIIVAERVRQRGREKVRT